MEIFPWEAQYETNVQQIDDQHKKLVKYLNELFNAMKARKGFDILNEILDGMTKYTVEHFSTEERLMRIYNYPDYDAHIKEHQGLVEEIQALKSDYANRKRTVSIDTMNYLKQWLSNHILGTDKKLGEYLSKEMPREAV